LVRRRSHGVRAYAVLANPHRYCRGTEFSPPVMASRGRIHARSRELVSSCGCRRKVPGRRHAVVGGRVTADQRDRASARRCRVPMRKADRPSKRPSERKTVGTRAGRLLRRRRDCPDATAPGAHHAAPALHELDEHPAPRLASVRRGGPSSSRSTFRASRARRALSPVGSHSLVSAIVRSVETGLYRALSDAATG
jgi:hypothetical protein